MALITIPYTFTVGAVIIASQHNSNFSTIANDYNGNIENVNISNTAAISDSKLDQITTASKVSGAALTSLGSIPAGAGVIPLANLAANMAYGDTRFKSVSFTHNTASGGDQAVTGVGFAPKYVVFFAIMPEGGVGVVHRISWGVWDNLCIADNTGIASGTYAQYSNIIALIFDGSNSSTAVAKTLDADGFTITWTETGSHSGTANIIALCFR
jgi:hypothetical protein